MVILVYYSFIQFNWIASLVCAVCWVRVLPLRVAHLLFRTRLFSSFIYSSSSSFQFVRLASVVRACVLFFKPSCCHFTRQEEDREEECEKKPHPRTHNTLHISFPTRSVFHLLLFHSFIRRERKRECVKCMQNTHRRCVYKIHLDSLFVKLSMENGRQQKSKEMNRAQKWCDVKPLRSLLIMALGKESTFIIASTPGKKCELSVS